MGELPLDFEDLDAAARAFSDLSDSLLAYKDYERICSKCGQALQYAGTSTILLARLAVEPAAPDMFAVGYLKILQQHACWAVGADEIFQRFQK